MKSVLRTFYLRNSTWNAVLKIAQDRLAKQDVPTTPSDVVEELLRFALRAKKSAKRGTRKAAKGGAS